MSLAGGSLFTYKNLISDANIFLHSERRAVCRKYSGIVFGEVGDVVPLVCISNIFLVKFLADYILKDTRVGLIAQIRCPEDVSCYAVEMFMAQIRLLRSVIDAEDVENPGDSSASWFVPPPPNNVVPRFADPCFYVYIMATSEDEFVSLAAETTAGKQIQVSVAPERIDIVLPDGGLEKHYALVAEDMIFLLSSDLPVSYACGHGHCYTCIRVWLEERWECPDCKAVITSAPNRVYGFEDLFKRVYGDWDTCTVSYDWTGLVFPVVDTNA
ncbi:hypothetical protein C8R46DRAFT_1213574 [Mycena filopes]|nr:hypothetical protein C8R46DRAFT_1213574 [Mycena filopes]